MNYISLKKAEEYLNNGGGEKRHSRAFLISQIKKGRLRGVKLASEWLTTKEWLNEYTKEVKPEKEKALILRLYFGWQLKIILEKAQKSILYPFKTYWQEAVAVLMLIALVSSSLFFYFPSKPKPIQAATYTWTQSSWAGGATTTDADHSTDQDDWIYYASSTWGISTGTGAVGNLLTLTATSTSSTTENTDTHFNNGTLSTTTVVGSGSDAYIGLTSTGFTHRKQIPITGAAGATTDYQVSLTLWNNTTTDVAGEVNLSNNALNFPNDIRFTDDDGTTYLDYWIEATTTDSSTVWVEVADNLSSSQNIYIYYGSSTAVSASNGPNTFAFFDSFDSDLSQWTAGGTPTISNSTVALNDDDVIRTNSNWGLSYAGIVRAKATEQDTTIIDLHTLDSYYLSIGNSDGVMNDDFDTFTCSCNVLFGEGGSQGSNVDFRNVYYNYEVGRVTGEVKYWQAGTLICTNTTGVPTSNFNLRATVWDSSQESTLTWDWALVRKYASPEPSVGIATNEEVLSFVPGAYISTTIDLGQNSDLTTIEWTATTTVSTTVKFQIRSASTSVGVDVATWYGPTGAGENYYTSTGTTINSIHGGDRYIQYQATLETTDVSQTPELDEVKINYQLYSNSISDNELWSSEYNSLDLANVIAGITWWEDSTSTARASTTVDFQLRTSADGSTWTEWYGPTATGTNYFESIASGCTPSTLATSTQVSCTTIHIDLRDGSNDQYVQYRTYLDTNNQGMKPTLYDVQLTYVVNASPQLQSFTASQSGSSVNISYQARDTDTASGAYIGYVDITLWEYSIDGGATYTNASDTCFATIDWATATVATSPQTDWTTTTATWAPTCDIGTSLNTSQAVLRITIDDGEAANNTTIATTSTFTLDLREPTISAVASTTNVATATITFTTDINANTFVDYGTSTTDLVYLYSSSSESVTSHKAEISNLIASTTYYYQVRSGNTTDNNSDSFYTFTTLPDTTAPNISNATATAVDLHSGTITWITNEEASSQVVYSPNPDMSSASSTTIVTDLRKEHSVILSNLTLNTAYYFQASSSDLAGNSTSTATSTFTTNNAQEDITSPNITVGPASTTNLTTSTVTWTTDESSNSIVDYGLTENLGSVAADLDESVTSHSVTITSLTASTTYIFQVRSQDSAGNSTTSATSTFTTIQDTTAPSISNIATSTVSYDSATIVWDTNESAVSKIEYGETSSYGSTTSYTSTYTTHHSASISSLTENTTYNYAVYSKDASENEASSTNQTFVTEEISVRIVTSGGGGAAIDTIPPGVGSVKVTEITETGAKISWSTSENATGRVKYGTTITYNKEQSSQGAGRDHTTTLESLSPGTTYHFQVEAKDFSSNIGSSADNTFTTLGESEEESTPGEEEEEPTPGEEEEEDGSETIEIVKQASKNLAIKLLEAFLENPWLKDIEEKTLTDSFSELASKLGSPPQVSGDLPQVEIGATTVRVIWTTDKESNSLVAYVKQTEYDSAKEEPYTVILGNPYHQVIYHEVLIENLEPNTTYHYQVRSQAKIGPITKSEDQTFTTLSQIPEISEVKFVDISPESAIITFNTNLPAKTNLTITDTRTGQQTETEDISYLKEHQIQIEDLDISTDYSLTLIAEDEEGTKSLPSILPFSTAISLKPPEITNVRITTSLIPGRTEKVQAIISWKTSKPATSKVYYEEGISQREDLQFFTREDIILNTDHIVITTAFKPGRVYRFRVQSTDSIGNTTYSKDYTILTPKPKESVLDLIIQNFEQTFSFLQRLRF